MGRVDSPETPEIYENTRKFHKSDKTLYQTKRDINKLCLGEISLQKALRFRVFECVLW